MKSSIKLVTVAVMVSLLTAITTVVIYSNLQYYNNEEKSIVENNSVETWYSSMPATPAIKTDFTEAAESSVKAVVHVKVKVKYRSNYVDIWDLLRGTVPEERMVEGSGSGVIISKDGYIVTNNHVVSQSNEVEVILNDKRSFDARVIGADPTTDIALLKVDGEDLPTLPFGNSDNLRLGEWVLAVGNPFNLSTTVTAGIVSAKARGIGILGDRNQLGIEAFIQTDAAVNRGNSGGALVNTNGELVGINSAIASPTGAYAGYSFAVPVSIVKKVVADLMEFGKVQRAYLGIMMRDIDAKLAEEKDLKTLKGVYVSELVESGAADDAGMKAGDVITGINNVEVNSGSELLDQLSRYRPGDKIQVQINRKKDAKVLNLTLKNRDGNTSVVKKSDAIILGAEFKKAEDELLSSLGLENGVQVVNAGSGKFDKYGITEGFVITKINNRRIVDVEDINTVLQEVTGGLFISGVYPNGKKAYYAINLEE